MLCPVDNETLVMADRNGVEIDYCPKCRGVWLDRGELDKIIERAGEGPTPAKAAPAAAPVPPPPPPPAQGYAPSPPAPGYPQGQPYPQQGYARGGWDSDDRNDDDYYRRHGHYPKKKKSILRDIFDF
ncbi:MAG: zf-TFIIB domain-containing protein [Rhodobacteraceae bacterium]|nr:zf-TFIIB domain-containing protein [Paracoccaceae bacterium]